MQPQCALELSTLAMLLRAFDGCIGWVCVRVGSNQLECGYWLAISRDCCMIHLERKLVVFDSTGPGDFKFIIYAFVIPLLS